MPTILTLSQQHLPLSARASIYFYFCFSLLFFLQPKFALQNQLLPYFSIKLLVPFLAYLVQFFVQGEKDQITCNQ